MFKPARVKDRVVAPETSGFTAQRRQRKREWFAYYVNTLRELPVPREEIDAHFAAMPERYWDSVNEHELSWGLQTIHRFLREVSRSDAPGTAPVLDVRNLPTHGITEVLLCTWDRHGLLAKVAGCLSALQINVLQADVYTRSDGIVLDIFRVCEPEGRPVTSAARVQEVSFLIEGALCEPPRFASLWACSRHKFLTESPGASPRISFDNVASPEATLLTIEAEDRLGLLHDVLNALTGASVNICHALIDTDEGIARDTFYVTDKDGFKIEDLPTQSSLRAAIVQAIVN